MIHVEECSWKGAKSVELYGKLYIPDGAMRAFVVMVHGLGEHGGCYKKWGEDFSLQSIGFLTFDLRGHGKSPGIRGHTTLQLIENDIQMIVQNVKNEFPSVPVVLFGHSMGGLIVLSCVTKKNVDVQGVIASSPWLRLVHPPLTSLVWLARWVSYIVPWLTVHTGIKADQLSHDGFGSKRSKTDPLLHTKISIKLFSDLWVKSKKLLRDTHNLNIPLLLMHGSADPLTSHLASKSFAKNIQGYITFKKWHGMRHDLYNDAGNEVVFQYVIKWLKKHIIKNGTIQNYCKLYPIG